jgi:hypothetical protein
MVDACPNGKERSNHILALRYQPPIISGSYQLSPCPTLQAWAKISGPADKAIALPSESDAAPVQTCLGRPRAHIASPCHREVLRSHSDNSTPQDCPRSVRVSRSGREIWAAGWWGQRISTPARRSVLGRGTPTDEWSARAAPHGAGLASCTARTPSTRGRPAHLHSREGPEGALVPSIRRHSAVW